ncbi:hypothetical protein G9A89_020923 [Geosiphon pyriformis]|nr:hypothetical protein G9A89_020923 [Geosiphon pyriformis]
MEGGNIKQISQPFKQTKSNIPPATITEDTTLAVIFLFDINNLNTHSLFSRAVINQDKPIMALYIDARVGGIDIKLILDSGSARNDWLLKANATLNWNTQELQLMFNGQHAQVPATCGHFKTQCIEELLIEFEDTLMPPTIEIYQNGPLPPNTIADLVYWKDLDDQNDKASETTHCALHVAKSCQMKDSGMMCLAEEEHETPIKDTWKQVFNRLDGYPHNDHEIWRMANAKAEGTTPEEIREIKDNPWTPKYNEPDYPEDDFFTDDPDTFQN